MTAARFQRLQRWSGWSAWIGWAALLVWAILAWFAPGAAGPAYRFAAFACFQPALGCLIFSLIYRLTGGQWGEALEIFLSAGIRLLPWIWPLVALLVFFPAARPEPAALGLPHSNLPSRETLLIRALVYELVFIGLREVALRKRARRFAGPGLILLVFTLHFLAADWFFVLDPQWYSSGFPLVWMSVAAVAGLGWSIALASAAGRDPAASGSSGRPLGLDWGDLILATVIFSSYVAFVQFLIIWSGNLPREIAWYVRRDGGFWRGVVIGLVLFYLAFPAAFMLFRGLKKSRRGVPGVAWLLFGMQAMWAGWFILPAFADRGPLFPVLCAVALVAGVGLFANRYLAVVLRLEQIQ